MKKFLLIMLLVYGCSATETVIKDKRIELSTPAIKDTIEGVYKEFPKPLLDSIKILFEQLPDSATIEGEVKMPNSDTPGNIKYKPKTNEFILDLPPQKVDTTITDTNKTVIKKETTTAEKFGYGTIGIIVFVVIALLVFAVIKFKVF